MTNTKLNKQNKNITGILKNNKFQCKSKSTYFKYSSTASIYFLQHLLMLSTCRQISTLLIILEKCYVSKFELCSSSLTFSSDVNENTSINERHQILNFLRYRFVSQAILEYLMFCSYTTNLPQF